MRSSAACQALAGVGRRLATDPRHPQSGHLLMRPNVLTAAFRGHIPRPRAPLSRFAHQVPRQSIATSSLRQKHDNQAQTETASQRPTSEAIPYKGPPLPNVVDDLIVPDILPTPLPSFSSMDTDERLWVPQAPDIDFRPLILSVSQGYFVNLLRVRRSGILSRHRHTGPVHAVTLKGRWHYLKHAWWANEGGYSYEPSGDIHTLEVPSGVEEMVTLFHVTGAYVYVDPEGNALGVEDVFSKLQSARDHYEKVGLGAKFADHFIR